MLRKMIVRREETVGKKTGRLEDVFPVVLLVMASSIFALSIGACSRVPQIEVERQEARLSPILLGVCSVFMKIENSGNRDDVLLGAKADISGTITELHDMKDGKMVRREKIPIPAKSAVELRPGGPHIMVLKMPQDAVAGYEFKVRLVFEQSGEKVVSVSIR
jgi:copper(I)-binding protein